MEVRTEIRSYEAMYQYGILQQWTRVRTDCQKEKKMTSLMHSTWKKGR